MEAPILAGDTLLWTVLDAMPSMVFVMDRETRVRGANREAKHVFDEDHPLILRRLCGEVLHCLNASRSSGGCGTTEFCPDCVIRRAVARAVEGESVFREAAQLVRDLPGEVRECWYLVTASPFQHDGTRLALLVLEDVSALYELRKIVPMCAGCRRIRDTDNLWHQVDSYFTKRAGIKFSHGLCPECLQKAYPDIAGRIARDRDLEEET